MAGLLTPLDFAGLHLRNRIVMPPMASGRAQPDGRPTDATVAYHQLRAQSGCGLIIVEHAFVMPEGRFGEGQIGVHDDQCIDGLARVAQGIHAGGAVACLQLSHAGALASGATEPVGPSSVAHPRGQGRVPRALDVAGLRDVVRAFADAAARAQTAGFDAVEVHAAHGFLLSQFLSPLTNRRTDEYGGDVLGRSRLHVEVLRAVRERLGPRTALFLRLGACDDLPDGLLLADACAVAPRLVDAGAQMLDVSGGLQGSRPSEREGQGYFRDFAAAIKAVVRVPVMTTGGIHDPDFANRLVRDGVADLVGIGRAMLSDPHWAARAITELTPPQPSLT